MLVPISVNLHGTNDTLYGDYLFGDATGSLQDNSKGGNDLLFGTGLPGDVVTIYGDAWYQYDDSQGGNILEQIDHTCP
jgi:hypothetical protein